MGQEWYTPVACLNIELKERKLLRTTIFARERRRKTGVCRITGVKPHKPIAKAKKVCERHLYICIKVGKSNHGRHYQPTIIQ